MKSYIWNKGYDAYHDGVRRNENPYEDDDFDFEDWQDGWDKANSDCDSDDD